MIYFHAFNYLYYTSCCWLCWPRVNKELELASQRNANIECWLGCFVILKGSGPILLRNPIFWGFFRGVRTPSPPSGSAYGVEVEWFSFSFYHCNRPLSLLILLYIVLFGSFLFWSFNALSVFKERHYVARAYWNLACSPILVYCQYTMVDANSNSYF